MGSGMGGQHGAMGSGMGGGAMMSGGPADPKHREQMTERRMDMMQMMMEQMMQHQQMMPTVPAK
jgi:hypothetical protein